MIYTFILHATCSFFLYHLYQEKSVLLWAFIRCLQIFWINEITIYILYMHRTINTITNHGRSIPFQFNLLMLFDTLFSRKHHPYIFNVFNHCIRFIYTNMQYYKSSFKLHICPIIYHVLSFFFFHTIHINKS